MRIALLAMGLLLPIVCGCRVSESNGPARHTVTGTVTFEGKPLESGLISFEAADDAAIGLAPASSEIVDGKYSLTATTGKKTVKVSRTVEAGRDQITQDPILKESIPAKYNQKSTLEYAVVEGDNSHDIAL
ncbi:hypothetical protein [Blastopirellula retiformator]|uniref:Carboxypeptidase regulatory-like domain-containing protein n=1 Tax=Blastopirellula retiformator TaxID=2527970 RepID=A0A5C5UTH6_9BACT|nr:hypothetical protein [Blastopirellula retiformator]TWT29691.1 hypothetical protein Enr8_48790 [Blastopirellula retiformator]